MSDLPYNPAQLPGGITEEDLLALVEGGLGETRAQSVRAALADRPDLLRLVDAMADDREATAVAFEPVQAPPALMARVEATLERELLTAAIVEPEVTELRRVERRQPGVIASIMDLLAANSLARGLAVAAGFILAGGVILVGITTILSQISEPTIVATDDPGASDAPTLPERTREPALASNDEPQPVEGLPDDTALASNTTPGEGDPTEGVQDSPFTVADAMDVENALTLAREGRLAVRVRVGNPDLALARIENVQRRALRDGILWRTLTTDSGAAIQLAIASPAPRDLTPTNPGAPTPPTIAGQDGPDATPLTTEPGAATSHQHTAGPVAAAYSLQLSDSATMLGSLRRVLTRDRFQVAEFVELTVPVETEPSLDPRAAFWWDQPPANWAKKIHVPVIVETMPE